MNRLLITGPSQSDPGGVSAVLFSLIPFFEQHFKVDYLEIGSTNSSIPFINILFDPLRLFFRLLRSPDLVLINPSLNAKSFYRDGVFLLLIHIFHKPAVVFLHGWDEFFYSNKYRFKGFLFSQAYNKVEMIFVLASEFKNKLRDVGVSVPIYRVTTMVSDELMKGDAPISFCAKEMDTVLSILFISRLAEEKGAMATLNSVIRLLKEKKSVCLTIAGSGEDECNILKTLADSPNLNGKIRFVGYVSGMDKRKLLMGHDVFCFPTTYGEGLPVAVLEAISFGLPVVTYPIAGLADVMEGGKMGVLLDDEQNKEEVVYQALNSLIEQPLLIEKISRYNLSISDRFTARHVSDLILKLIRIEKM